MIDKKTGSIFYFLFTICIVVLSFAPCLYAKNLTTGIVLADDKGKILHSQNRTKKFIPASILKILTSLAAIDILGEDYRFPTEYSFDPDSKDLYIKGFGDPLFISEVIEKLCQKIISTTRAKHIHNIVLDHTYFSEQILIPGKGNSLNPYDAPIGAFCANFNTLMFKWDGQKNQFISGESQTPLLSIFRDDIQRTKLKKGRIILSKQQSILYPGLLIKHFLEKKGVVVTGLVLPGTFKTQGRQTQTFLSPFEIQDAVQKLLKYSNNYIANQLLLTMGAKTYGAPANLEKGIKAISQYSNQQLKLNHFTIMEGSGLSRSNLISPDQMLKILIKFRPYHFLLKNKGMDFFKTGTLSGVRTRAGYILGKDKKLYPYVIMVNEKNKGYELILNNLLKIIYSLN